MEEPTPFPMITNYLKLAWRNITRQKLYSLLNILGLTIGFTSSIIIGLYLHSELTYDKFHSKADRIYRVIDFRLTDGVGERMASTVTPAAEALLEDYPHIVEDAVRFFDFHAPTLSLAITSGANENTAFNEENVYFTDPSVFTVFDFQLLKGSEQSALTKPNQIILTEKMAAKYFPGEDPMGKILRFEDKQDLVVSGVLKDPPANSHISINFLISFSTLDNTEILPERLRQSWIWNPTWTYVLLRENTPPARLEENLPAFVYAHFPESRRDIVKLYLQPLTDIHLNSDLNGELQPNSSMNYIWILGSVGLLVILIAAINYVNLATSRSVKRAREVGLRKTLGASKPNLILQFLGESVMIVLGAVFISMLLTSMLLPIINAWTGSALFLFTITQWKILLIILAGGIFIGLLAGIYPALVIASHSPVKALKGTKLTTIPNRFSLRKALVVSQFTISIALIIAAYFTYKQLDYLQKQDTGIDREEILLIPVSRSNANLQFDAIKDELLTVRGVHQVTLVEHIPGKDFNTGNFKPEGVDEPRQFQRLMVMPGIVETLGLELIAGAPLSEGDVEDESEVIINEQMVKYLGWNTPEDAVGRVLHQPDTRVRGVVKDFNFSSLHEPIKPFVFVHMSKTPRALSFFGRYLTVRFNLQNLQEIKDEITTIWYRRITDRALKIVFLDDTYTAMYQKEQNLSRVIILFTSIAVFIACMGLFALSSYMVEQRKAEIGIRKVLGASFFSSLMLIIRDFLVLITIAIAIAIPLALLFSREWLSNFAFQIEITSWPFVISGAIALLIALLTISYHSLKLATINPVEVLKNE